MSDSEGFQPTKTKNQRARQKESKKRSAVRKAEKKEIEMQKLSESKLKQAFLTGVNDPNDGFYTPETAAAIEALMHIDNLYEAILSETFKMANARGFNCREIIQTNPFKNEKFDDCIVIDLKNNYGDYLIMRKPPVPSETK